MKQKKMTLKNLRTLIERCLAGKFTLAFFLPDAEKRPPTWKEVREAAVDGYALALSDILDALDGDTEALELALTEDGRLAIRDEDWPIFEKLMEDESEESQ